MGSSDSGDALTSIDISANFGVGFLPLAASKADSFFSKILAFLGRGSLGDQPR